LEFPETRILLQPPAPFSGTINPSARESTPAQPPTLAALAGAPNVLLNITDDAGFGAPSTFGGVIPTPALDEVAQAGLRYTQFHTTALCSPTRAALLTERNPHPVGFGAVSELSTGFRGYNAIIGADTVTIGETLRQNGYATAWFGKNHNTPPWEANPVGPFQRWPGGLGFDFFYGFMGGETSQWKPGNLYRNTTRILHFEGRPGWNLTTAMADEAIAHIPPAERGDAESPLAHPLRAGWRARPAPRGAGMDRTLPRPLRRGVEGAARAHLREPASTGRAADQRGAHPMARYAAALVEPLRRLAPPLRPPGRDVRRLPRLQRP
jgi:arylsulfatase A-like enzyme